MCCTAGSAAGLPPACLPACSRCRAAEAPADVHNPALPLCTAAALCCRLPCPRAPPLPAAPLFCRPLQVTGRTKRCLNLGSYNYLGFAAQVSWQGCTASCCALPGCVASVQLPLQLPGMPAAGLGGGRCLCSPAHLTCLFCVPWHIPHPQDPYCTPRVEEALDQLGWASASARADAGTTPRHVELERLVAQFLVRSCAVWWHAFEWSLPG